MKKNILLLIGFLISCNLFAVIDYTHDPQTICEKEDDGSTTVIQPFQTNFTGNNYIWYNSSGTKVKEGERTYTPSVAGEYTCEVITSGSYVRSGNLITYGGFNFEPSQLSNTRFEGPVSDPITNKQLYPKYELDKFDRNGNCNSGFYTTSDNPNKIKEDYFCKIKPYEGSHMLVVDGETNSNAFTVFYVRELELLAGQTYEFSCQVANIDSLYHKDNHGKNSLANLRFLIKTKDTNDRWEALKPENSTNEGYLQVSENLAEWELFSASYTARSNTYAEIKIENTTNTPTVAGNDFVIDALYFGAERNVSETKKTESFKLIIDKKPKIKLEATPTQPCPSAKVAISSTVTNSASTATLTWGGDASGSTGSVSIDAASAVGGTKTCFLTVTNGACKTSENITITTISCGEEETYSPCFGDTNVALVAKTTGTNYEWILNGSTIQNGSSNKYTATAPSTTTPAEYTCKVTTSTGVVTETHTINAQDCEEKYPGTICNNGSLTLTNTATGKEYIWTKPGESTPEIKSTPDLTISGAGKTVEETYTYTCIIKNASGNIVAVEKFPILVENCNENTQDTEEHQVNKNESITIKVPEDKKCPGNDGQCKYAWYKRNPDGTQGESVVKNPTDNAWEHTISNPQDEEYMCVITYSNGDTHTQIYKITVYSINSKTYCYTANSEEEQKITQTLEEGDTDEYEWFWKKGNELVPFPEGSITTDKNNITLDVTYFADNNSKFPVNVHVIEKFKHKVESPATPTDQGQNQNPEQNPEQTTGQDSEQTPEQEPEPAPAPPVSSSIDPVNINSTSLTKSNMTKIDDKTYTYESKIKTEDGEEKNITNKLIIGDAYKYTDTFDSKYENMSSHEGVVRLTDTGINGCSAYTENDPNNKYFIEVDGGDTAGPVLSIHQKTKIIDGKKYALRFLVRETSTTTGAGVPLSNAAEIDFQIIINGESYGVSNVIRITNREWEERTFYYIADGDADEVTIVLRNHKTSSEYNDFAIDDISFTLAPPVPENRNATAFDYDEEEDEDGDGYLTWKDEYILIIHPNTTQTITESSSPRLEYEKEVTLPFGETITFKYDPSEYQEGMTEYKAEYETSDNYGCTHEVYFILNLIAITPDIYFTPNNDGINDKWMIEGIEGAPNAHIMIYDRHSKLLYKGIGSEFQGWDGNYNGHGMVQDDYWYVIQIPETEETLSGHFILKR